MGLHCPNSRRRVPTSGGRGHLEEFAGSGSAAHPSHPPGGHENKETIFLGFQDPTPVLSQEPAE